MVLILPGTVLDRSRPDGLNLLVTLRGRRHHHHPHFTDEETEKQVKQVAQGRMATLWWGRNTKQGSGAPQVLPLTAQCTA